MARNGRRNNSLALLLIVLGGVVLLAVGGWLGWQLIQPDVTPVPAPAKAVATQDVTRLNLADSKAAFDQKSAVFLDVRDTDSYGSGHIPGALSIPLNELPDRLEELDPNSWIITYCT